MSKEAKGEPIVRLPASIDFGRNEHEYHQAIKVKVFQMVEWTLRTGKPVGRKHLQSLGPGGLTYFHRQLALRTDQQISDASKLRSALSGAAEISIQVASSKAEDGLKGSTAVLLPTQDWPAQRRLRVGFQRRAAGDGWLIAIVLTSLAAAALKFVDGSQPNIIVAILRGLK